MNIERNKMRYAVVQTTKFGQEVVALADNAFDADTLVDALHEKLTEAYRFEVRRLVIPVNPEFELEDADSDD